MIDIHNRLLQKLEDGPSTIEESIQVCEAPRPQGGASRKGSFVHIVPLGPAYTEGLAGHLPARSVSETE